MDNSDRNPFDGSDLAILQRLVFQARRGFTIVQPGGISVEVSLVYPSSPINEDEHAPFSSWLVEDEMAKPDLWVHVRFGHTETRVKMAFRGLSEIREVRLVREFDRQEVARLRYPEEFRFSEYEEDEWYMLDFGIHPSEPPSHSAHYGAG